jgi:hypothetical protein
MTANSGDLMRTLAGHERHCFVSLTVTRAVASRTSTCGMIRHVDGSQARQALRMQIGCQLDQRCDGRGNG